VAQGRADWGVAIEWVARHHKLGFFPLDEEHFDFVTPQSRAHRPAVIAFKNLLNQLRVRQRLTELGMRLPDFP
jgi:putative molybdopterin biosynthesis protein